MIIAEIGLNHMGSMEYLDLYLQHLLQSPVDAITLQIREKEFYKNTRFQNLELPEQTYRGISDRVRSKGKLFGMAISDLKYLSFLDDKIDFYKILSKDIDNEKIINELVNKIDKPMFVSTGTAL
jgi:sialic acid synthase SpsE